jgi:hypothetical protein
MSSKILAVVLLAVGCVTAAGTGAYWATRHNAAGASVAQAAALDAYGAPATAATPVTETEAVVAPVSSVAAAVDPAVDTGVEAPRKNDPERVRQSITPRRQEPARSPARRAASSAPVAERPAVENDASEAVPVAPPSLPAVASGPVDVPLPEPIPLPPLVLYEDVVVPASSVIGLRVETALSSERAQVEDRVDARVTRDVTADGRVAIPAGARAVGSVTLVERGGKMKERARLGVRFHTLVLADGREVPIATDAIFREGESPTGESTRKIGGAAAGGAILGALLGGKKGAIMGGAAGAGAGTAAVMAGGRNAATLAAGTVLTVRLSSPVSIEVEKR